MNIGDVLGGRYEVLRTISTGPRATVLQALDHRYKKTVALKAYPVAGTDTDALLDEARLLMELTANPALPAVRNDFFTEDGDHYVVVLNWVDGKNLQEIVDDEGDPGLSFGEAIEYLAEAAHALDHLHSHDPVIVHGDVKPANLIRGGNGHVVLVDFDIAGADAAKGRVGTIGYVAPEVIAGEKPTMAADIYGLAATAVTLLNGRPASEAAPTYTGTPFNAEGHIARVLRNAMLTDPVTRPRSASRLVEQLRSAVRDENPTGVVAFLATEVADSSRLWDTEPAEMRVAMTRLRDLRDELVERRGGRLVSSMNEGDRTITAFREASAAALAALDLHDRVASAGFPPDVVVKLRAAVAVGEAALVDGVYTGAVIEQLLRLRALAAPGTTIAPEPTAELLVGLVGESISIVPLGTPAGSGLAVFVLTRPGAEATAIHDEVELDSQPVPTDSSPDDAPARASRRRVAMEALERPLTLAALMIVGFAVIFRVILADEFEAGTMAEVVMFVALGVFAASFGWTYVRCMRAQRDAIAESEHERELEKQARTVARERVETRQQLQRDFGAIGTVSGQHGIKVLRGLSDEFDAIEVHVRVGSDRQLADVPAMVPHLAEEAYRNGMSALSDALGLLESAESPTRRRLDDELCEIEERLADADYPDERARSRDEARRESNTQLIARFDESRQRAQDLLFEAERCTNALAEARLELASLRAGNTQVDVDAVVQSLQRTIRHVRDVQDEFRKLGY